MFKLFRSLFFILLVITGLYFFGDFRINDTNVRDYLHSVITADNLRKIKSEVTFVYDTIQKLINEFDADVDFDEVQNIKTLEPNSNQSSSTTNNSLSEPTKPQEKVFQHEKDKVLDLIKSNIGSSTSEQ